MISPLHRNDVSSFASMTERSLPQLVGGSIGVGIALTIAVQSIALFGLSLNILNDQSRQKCILLLCVIGSVSAGIFHTIHYLESYIGLLDGSLFVLMVCGQFSLIILNHNSLVRALSLSSVTFTVEKVQRLCLVLYLVPFATMVPSILAFTETWPNYSLTASTWYRINCNLLFMGLLVSTEVFATYTDILIIRKITALEIHSKTVDDATRVQKKKGILHIYLTILLFLVVDLTLKGLVLVGYPFFFDGIVTLIIVCLRARVNLNYGLLLKQVMASQHRSKSGALDFDKNPDLLCFFHFRKEKTGSTWGIFGNSIADKEDPVQQNPNQYYGFQN
ncbi:hypothetical protein EDD86DRAFT_200439, partial [Gorgonomyces haynaldii]